MAKKPDKGKKAEEETSVKGKKTAGEEQRTVQPPPPDYQEEDGSNSPATGKGPKDKDNGQHGRHHVEDVVEAIYTQLAEVRKVVDTLLQETKDAKMRRRYELAPVRVGDLMKGFQSAVAKANRATMAGELDGEDIERMSIKDLEVSLDAPIIHSGHAEDPFVMLPNINSADDETARISLRFNVVSVPIKQGG